MEYDGQGSKGSNLKIIIHRGSKEIGGTCIQLSTDTTTILLDLGQPLSKDSRHIDVAALRPAAVLVSHPHQDHFGLIDELDPSVPVYISGLGKSLIDATRVFLGRDLHANTFRHFKPWKEFQVGDFKVTPYLVDHSASAAYAFLVEADGKRVFYSGDFRAHGRKSQLFQRMIAKPPQNIDLLFLEGTMLNRSNEDFPTEESVEEKILETIRHQQNITFLITSSQNIDRIVSGFRACKRSGKTLVIDIYTAWILEQMKQVTNNVPAMEWDQVGLYASYNQDQTLQHNPGFFGDFRKRVYQQRVTKDDLQNAPADYLYVGKMSHHRIIDCYKVDKPVNVIYSQWLGYLKCSNEEYFGAKEFAAYRDYDPQVNFVYAHTSGHATVEDLQRFAKALKPKILVPVHTEYGNRFSELFENTTQIEDACQFQL
jgi:ribonuclease J